MLSSSTFPRVFGALVAALVAAGWRTDDDRKIHPAFQEAAIAAFGT